MICIRYVEVCRWELKFPKFVRRMIEPGPMQALNTCQIGKMDLISDERTQRGNFPYDHKALTLPVVGTGVERNQVVPG